MQLHSEPLSATRLAFYLTALGTLIFLFAGNAYADAGIPMIFITYPRMLIALLPIIILETVIFERGLHFGYQRVARRVGIANAVSTVIGFPLTWFLFVLLEMFTGGGSFYTEGVLGYVLAVTWQHPWLMPYEGKLHWMVPTAAMVGLIPAFFSSVGVEGFILRRLFKKVDAARVWQLTWRANIASYCILIGLDGIWLIHSMRMTR